MNMFEAMTVIFLFSTVCIYISYPLLSWPYSYVCGLIFRKKKKNPDGLNSRRDKIDLIQDNLDKLSKSEVERQNLISGKR